MSAHTDLGFKFEYTDNTSIVIGISVERVVALAITLVTVSQLGLKVSGFGYLSFRLTQMIAPMLGFEPLDPDVFKRPFDSFLQLLIDPVGAKIGSLDRSPLMTEILFQLALGGVVVVLTLVIEITMLVAVTGGAYALYGFFGISINLISAYELVLSFVILVTLSIMTYGNRRIQQAIEIPGRH